MNTRKGMIVGMLLLAAASLAGAQEWRSTTVEDMELSWSVDGEDLLLKVSAPTTGWVAIGFEPSRAMADADILIGYVDDGVVAVEDHFGNSMFSHRPDEDLGGQTNVTVLGGSESDDRTEIEFSIPLSSGDEFDKSLQAGRRVKVILAWGRNDNIGRKHQERYTTEITL